MNYTSEDMDNPCSNVLQRSKQSTYLEKYMREYAATIRVTKKIKFVKTEFGITTKVIIGNYGKP